MSTTIAIAEGVLQLMVPFKLTGYEVAFIKREWLRAWEENGQTAGHIGIEAERLGADLVVSIRIR